MSQSLRLFSDTLDEWLECQKKWLYLENIFIAPDIQRQLPNETKLFGTVDRQFKSILRITRDRPAALPVSKTARMNSVTAELAASLLLVLRFQLRMALPSLHEKEICSHGVIFACLASWFAFQLCRAAGKACSTMVNALARCSAAPQIWQNNWLA